MKPYYHVIDNKTGKPCGYEAPNTKTLIEDFDDKAKAKELRNRLNDKHNGWPTDKEGKRIPDAMPRFVVSKVVS